MSPRTSVDDVKATFDTDYGQEAVSQWIKIANDFVDDIADADSSVQSSRLENIELLLAQHLLAIQDQRVSEDRVGDSRASYQGETGMNFDATQYGQHAKLLDPTNVLENKEKQKPTVDVLDSRNTR